MNFFEQQDRARKRTGLLVLLFSLAVLCLVFASCVLVALFFALTQSSSIGLQGFLTVVLKPSKKSLRRIAIWHLKAPLIADSNIE
ncbi:hypothetical protein OAH38_01020 [Pseudomonadales bacterium]|nr:hypothetical protein [Pseudomonadales bacterium]